MFAYPALAVCFAEFRSSARRVRTFLCIAVATAGILGTLVLTTQATSQMAPLAGAYAPRFVLSAMGNYWLWLFLLAVVFRPSMRGNRMNAPVSPRPSMYDRSRT